MAIGIRDFESLLEKASADENFKKQFIENPKPILAEMGFEISEEVSVEVHENTLNAKHYLLPPKNSSGGANLSNLAPEFRAVAQQAWDNTDFKARLLADPKSAFMTITGERISDSISINVHEDTPKVKHLVFEVRPALDNVNEELTDEALEAVVGGCGCRCGWFNWL
jgi:hypothetical protein